MKKVTNIFNRVVSGLLALIMVAGMIPASVFGSEAITTGPGSTAPPRLTLEGVQNGTPYNSMSLNKVYPHVFSLSDGMNSFTGYCVEKGIPSPENKQTTFVKNDELTNNAMSKAGSFAWLLDATATKSGDLATNPLGQIALWMSLEGLLNIDANLSSNDPAWVASISGLAQERVLMLASMGHTVTLEESIKALQDMWDDWKSDPSTHGTFVVYSPETAYCQPLLIRIPNGGVVIPRQTGYIAVNKKGQGKGLGGAEFTVYEDYDSKKIAFTPDETPAIFTTDDSGWGIVQVAWRGAPIMTFTVVETKAPAGYKLSSTKYEVQVNANEHNTPSNPAMVGGSFVINIVGESDPKTTVIKKVDAKTGAGIGPAVFKIEGTTEAGEPYSRSWTCDASGLLDLQWLYPDQAANYIPPGTYSVTETEPPPGYKLSETGSKELRLWVEYDAANNPTAKASGELVFRDEPDEPDKPDNPPPPPDDPPEGIVKKIDAHTNQGVGPALFHFEGTSESGERYSGNMFCGADGVLNLQWWAPDQNFYIPPGEYTVTEVNPPEGYEITDSNGQHLKLWVETVEEEGDEEGEVTVTYVPRHSGDLVFKDYLKHRIIIRKEGEGGKPLKGATFEIYYKGSLLDTVTTGTNGEVLFEGPDGKGLSSGEYTIKETIPPDGYLLPVLNTQTIYVDSASSNVVNHAVCFKDYKWPEILIEKKEKGTNKALEGATFEVMIDGASLGTVTTGLDGKAVISYGKYGKYWDDSLKTHTVAVREKAAPEGYLIDDGDWQINRIEEGQTLSSFVFNDSKYPEIVIRKKDRETQAPLPGTQFEIKIDGGASFSLFKSTDANGEIHITYKDYKAFIGDMNWEKGWTVTVTETVMPDGYNRDKQPGADGGDGYTITQQLLPDQKLLEFEFVDTHYRDLKVIKRDSSNTWLLEGAVFKLESISLEDPAAGSTVSLEGKTDENGQFTFKDLPNGTYRLTEVTPPTGYEKADPDSQVITITSMSDRVIEATFNNPPKQGILIMKHDAITGKALPGTKFSVRYLGQADGSTSNSPVEYITNDNGVIYLPDRKAGFYEIREVSVPDGYILDKEPHIIEVTNQHESYVVDFQNYQDTQLIILKEDAQTGLPLAGARFKITTAGGNWIDTVVTGPNGYATLSGLKPGGYVITEVEAPDGHIIDPVPQTFEIREGQTEPIFKVFKNDGKINLFIRKEDAQTRLPLEGAVFKLSRINGQVVISRVVTGKDGLARIPNLDPGDYLIEEIEAPKGYILSDNPKQNVSLEAGTTTSVVFRNNKRGGIAILKRDAVSGLPLAGAEFKVSDVDHKPVGTFKTGLDGYIRISDLKEGYYFIQEVKAPEGYVLDSKEHQIYVEDFKVTLVELTNYERSTFVVNKVDAQSNVPLAGAKFAIYAMDGTQQGDPFITDVNGKASLSDLEPGWYILKELEAPEGYILNQEEFRIQIIEGQPSSLTVPNTPESGITVHKVDAASQAPLAGAEFELRTHDGKLVGTYVTDMSGSFVTKNVKPGVFYLRETRAPDGYALLEKDTQVTVIEGEHPVVTIENHKKAPIEIQKVDATTGKYLEGAVFDVWTLNCEKLLGTYTTDASGIVFTEPLPAGNYIVTEHKAPDGYITTDEHFHVQVLYDHPAVLKVANKPLTGIMITKLSSVDDQPLLGAKFEIRTAEGKVIGEFATDTAGDPIIAVEPGVYYVKETKAPDGYLLNEEVFRVEVEAGKIVPLVVRDDPEPSLVIYKADERTGKGVPGAVFKVETADGDFIGQYTTDAQGEALVRPIKPGHYIVTEVSAPDGYIVSTPNSKTITVKAGVVNRVEFKDAERGSLVIRLEDQKDGHKLENGRFELYWAADGSKVAEGVTDNSGSIVWGSLIPGDYIIKQTYAPDGYTRVDVELRATVVSGETVIVVFKDCTAGLVIEKIDRITKETLPGARFQVTRDTDNIVIGEYVTDEDGLALVSGLIPGLYTVEELVAPTGYEIDTQSQLVHVKAGEHAHVTCEDTPYGGITISTVDQKTNAPIPGVVIEVWRQNGELINTYTSGTTGVIQTDKLPNGMYVVKVIHTAGGYSAVANERTVEVKDGVAVNIKFEFAACGTLQILGLNTSETGMAGMKVKLTKIDGTVIGEYVTDVTGLVRVPGLEAGWYVATVVKAPDGYSMVGEITQNVEIISNSSSIIKFYFGKTYGVQIQTSVSQTGAMVEGVKYQIARLDGSIVGTYTSDAVGLLYARLEPGWYTVKMIELPAGYQSYVLCPSRNIEVVADRPAFVSFILTQLSGMRVKVVDGNSDAPLYGVNMLLKDSSGKIIDQYTTNNEGYITLRNTLVDGTYTLTMFTAPNGYTVDQIPKTIEILNGQTTEVVWKLFGQVGQIQVHVTSSEYNSILDKPAGSNLQGAVFEIYDPFNQIVIGTIESDSYGVAASGGLPIGRYIIREKSPAAYYCLSGKETEIYIKVSNDVVRAEYQEAPLTLKVNHAMLGISNISAGSFGKYLFTAVNNESSDRLDNFFWNVKVPTDAVRAGTLFTGKWNADVFYSIRYKTNMNDYRLLAEGLSSLTPYQYDLSSIALDSQSGEYVTDVRFEFGTVPAGFAVVSAPIFYNYVMPTVPNGFLAITRSECGGQYGDVWKTESSLWTTTVINTGNAGGMIPNQLPKTGY